ncbi:extracellular solute-binding protein [Actibacterium pelagium]|uniref:Sugar ABC transporter substrate-binding protein n=1 Tax=Actibacterium pelagium TaxID=2029103 RepID=A0A917ANN2_9RHOB|nr:extracellular solute-binding protein [Actibacterium pelagium]GGE61759.1 sugar ABC transporter substrate-binding protein [Actibacterium pelagium]
MKHILTAGAALAAGIAGQVQAGELTAWVMDAAAEKPYFAQLETAFNAAHSADGITLDVVPLPSYNDALQAATVDRSLPDIILVDGPNMASMAWAGTLQPIGHLVEPELLEDMLPVVKAQGTYGPTGEIYFLSQYDSSVILWGNRAMLEAANVRIPTSVEDAWTRDEMAAALEALAEVDGVKWPLDMKLNYGAGEWMTYGFAPFIQSNGGDLMNRVTWQADGALNGPESVEAITEIQNWYRNGWIVPASAGDNQFYGEKSAALSWVGNWMWPPHSEGLGEDLVFIPAPKFGPEGPKAPNGGWGWSVPASTENLDDVKVFLDFVMSAEQVAKYADITGFAPARAAAVPLSEKYGGDGPQSLFLDQGNCCAVVRPVHPAYPVITLSWSQAMQNILSDGLADVQTELDAAARAIDLEIEDSQGYPPFNAVSSN